MAIEDHGPGSQYVRELIRPHIPFPALVRFLVLMTAALALIAGLMVGRFALELGAAAGALREVFNDLQAEAVE
jgi:hypothetical protein